MRTKAHFVLGPLVTFAMTFWSLQNAWPQDAAVNASSTRAEDRSSDTAQKGKAVPAHRSEAVDVSGSRKWVPQLLTDFAQDQKQIWTAPARIRLADATWLVPLGGLTAALFATDRDYSRSLSHNPATIQHDKTISNAGIAGLVGAGAGLYLFSFPAHNPHWRETGFLAGEAALNSLLVTEALKYSLGRGAPLSGRWPRSFFSRRNLLSLGTRRRRMVRRGRDCA